MKKILSIKSHVLAIINFFSFNSYENEQFIGRVRLFYTECLVLMLQKQSQNMQSTLTGCQFLGLFPILIFLLAKLYIL